MHTSLRQTTRTAICLLCLGFDWPSRVDHYAYEFRQASSDDKRGLVALVAKDDSKEATELLLRALEDNDDSVRLATLEVLAARHVTAGLPILRDLCRDSVATLRAAAVAALSRAYSREDALPTVLRALDDADGRVRAAAAQSLEHMHATTAVPSLLGKLTDPDPDARLAVVKALGALGDAAAVAPLAATLDDEDSGGQRAAARALAQLGDTQATPALLQVAARGADEDIRIEALLALGRIGGEQTSTALPEHLQTAEGRTAMTAVAALGQLGSPSAVDALMPWLTHPTLGASVIDALAHAATLEVISTSRPSDLEQSPPQDAENGIVMRVVDYWNSHQHGSDHDALGRALGLLFFRLSEVTSLHGASELLLRHFTQAPTAELALALAATRTEAALIALLDGLHADAPALRTAILTALSRYPATAPYDSRVADVLLEALPTARPDELPLWAELLGKTGAPRAVPALVSMLASDDLTTKLAAIAALGALGSADANETLLPMLSKSLPEAIRWHASLAIGACADANTQERLFFLLQDPSQDAVAVARALSVVFLRPHKEPSQSAALDLQATLQRMATGADENAARAAIEVLAVYRPKSALPLLGRILREPSDSRREAAAAALGYFKAAAARPLLRYLLRRASPEVGLSALLSFAEVGDQRDLAAIMKVAARSHYPLPSAVPYVLSRWLERKVIATRTAQRALCSLVKRHEPLLRANAAAALAHAGAGPCDAQGVSASDFLALDRSQPERLAGAHWLLASLRDQSDNLNIFQVIRQRCALSDPNPTIRRVCLGHTMDPQTPVTHIVVLGSGHAPAQTYLVASQLADGSLRISRTSPSGTLFLHGIESSVLAIIDPGLYAIEGRENSSSDSEQKHTPSDSVAVQ